MLNTSMAKNAPPPSVFRSYAGDVEINVEIKKYFCKAGVKGIQVKGFKTFVTLLKRLAITTEPLTDRVQRASSCTGSCASSWSR